MVDLIDYIFQFPDFGSALRDTVIGPSFITPLTPGFVNKEILVYPNRLLDSVDAASGYWFIATSTSLSLQTHPNVQIVNDLTLMGQGQPSVVSALFDITNTAIVLSNFGPIYALGLQFMTPTNGYITEDGVAFYVAEDGTTFYVQES